MHPEIIQQGPGTCPKCGMALEPVDVSALTEADEEQSMLQRFWIGSIFAFAVFISAMGGDMLGFNALIDPTIRQWVEMVLSIPVVWWSGSVFYVRAYDSIRHRSLNMFTLIAIGTASAWGYSTVAVLFPSWFPPELFDKSGVIPVYFEAAAVITALVLLGQVLELRARSKTSDAIRMLLGLSPKTAIRITEEGSEEEVALSDVRIGDRFRIHPGEKIPVDGMVIAGESHVDESMVTGEPIPLSKKTGDMMIGGTINTTGTLVMEAKKVGADTLLSQIIAMVSQAQRSRAPIQKIADRVSGYFVPAVIGVSIITFVMWMYYGPEPALGYALINAVAVLIIACPCALGLATPISVVVAMGKGAGAGILIKNAEALELMEKIDTLVIDKTGTLTEGRPKVVSVTSLGHYDEKTLIRLAASLERMSEHPFANAMIEMATVKGIPFVNVEHFEAVSGEGIQGSVEGHSVVIGTAKLIEKKGIDTQVTQNRADQMRHSGESVVYMAIDDEVSGMIGMADPIKQSSFEAIDQLHAEGMQIVMLTGDNPLTAKAVGIKLGIDKIEAEVLPNQKAEIIKQLQNEGHIVAMAGDGINDAPALAQAHVGIAMGNGTDIAVESAQITLIKGDLRGIVRARKLSRATIINIKQNLFFAFFYNSVGIPIAAGALYPFVGVLLSPMVAAAAMSFSSVSVITNALRLRWLKL